METLLCPQLGGCADQIGNSGLGIRPQLYCGGLFPVPGLLSGMKLIHGSFPDSSGIGTAEDAWHGAGNIIAHPHRCRIVAGVAAEPGVLTAVGSAGFAGSRHVPGQRQTTSGAEGLIQGALEDICDHIGSVLLINVAGLRFDGTGQIPLLLVLKPYDAGAVVVNSAVGERAVALGHVNDPEAIGKAADTQGRNIVVNIGDPLKIHLP